MNTASSSVDESCPCSSLSSGPFEETVAPAVDLADLEEEWVQIGKLRGQASELKQETRDLTAKVQDMQKRIDKKKYQVSVLGEEIRRRQQAIESKWKAENQKEPAKSLYLEYQLTKDALAAVSTTAEPIVVNVNPITSTLMSRIRESAALRGYWHWVKHMGTGSCKEEEEANPGMIDLLLLRLADELKVTLPQVAFHSPLRCRFLEFLRRKRLGDQRDAGFPVSILEWWDQQMPPPTQTLSFPLAATVLSSTL